MRVFVKVTVLGVLPGLAIWYGATVVPGGERVVVLAGLGYGQCPLAVRLWEAIGGALPWCRRCLAWLACGWLFNMGSVPIFSAAWGLARRLGLGQAPATLPVRVVGSVGAALAVAQDAWARLGGAQPA